MATDASTPSPDRAISERALRIAVFAILAAALVLRVGAALHWDLPPRTDAYDYDRTAVSIADGRGYPEASVYAGGPGPSAFRPPSYPYLLGGVYALTGTSDPAARWEAGRILEALLGVAVVGLTMLIAFQLWGRVTALIAAGIAAIYPPLIYAGTSLLTEPLFTTLLLGGIAAVLQYRREDARVRWLLLAGVCVGLATLTRTNGIIAIIALGLGAWTLRPRFSLRALWRPALVVAVAAAVMAPWTIRNAVELHAFVPVSTQTGVALAGQYNDLAAGDQATWYPSYLVPRYCPLFFRVPRCPTANQKGKLEPRGLGEVEVDDRLTQLSKDFALDHPTHVIAAGFWNGLRFLDLDSPVATERREAYFTGQPQGFAQLSVYAFYLVAAVAIAGCFTAAARRMPLFIWLIPPLIMLSVMFVVATSRYRAPIEPIIVMLAACALTELWRRRYRPD